MQLDLALGHQREQFTQLVEIADEVSHEIQFIVDDAFGFDIQNTSVANHEVRAERSQHVDTPLLRATLGHEVEHYVSAPAAGELFDRVHLIVVHQYGVVRAKVPR